MSIWERGWLQAARINDAYGLLSLIAVAVGGVSLLISSILTWWTDPSTTFFGKILIALALGFALAFATLGLIGLAGWVSQRWRRGEPSNPISERATSPVVSTEATPAKAPVEFAIEGSWLNTPFQFDTLPAKNALLDRQMCCEDVYLTLTANDFLEHVRVKFIATDDHGRVIECWHKGVFEGTITPGMTEPIRVFRRLFYFERIAIRNDKGGHTHTKRRSDGDIIVFDGTPDETYVASSLINLEVHVHRKGRKGTESVTFILDTTDAVAPKTRLVVAAGPLQIKISNNYARPFGAAMIYEDITE